MSIITQGEETKKKVQNEGTTTVMCEWALMQVLAKYAWDSYWNFCLTIYFLVLSTLAQI